MVGEERKKFKFGVEVYRRFCVRGEVVICVI